MPTILARRLLFRYSSPASGEEGFVQYNNVCRGPARGGWLEAKVEEVVTRTVVGRLGVHEWQGCRTGLWEERERTPRLELPLLAAVWHEDDRHLKICCFIERYSIRKHGQSLLSAEVQDQNQGNDQHQIIRDRGIADGFSPFVEEDGSVCTTVVQSRPSRV